MDRKITNINNSDAMQINPNLAIILAHNMDGWFFERYLNIFMYHNIVDYVDNVNYAGLIKQYREYSYDEIIRKGLFALIEKELSNADSDCFLHVWVDEYELPCSIRYQRCHFVHPLTVYGFDKIAGVFETIFFDVNKGNILVGIKYLDLYRSVFNVKDYYLSGGTEETLCKTLCCCAYIQRIKGTFHLDVLIKQLNNYLCSCNDQINEWFNLSRQEVFDNNDIVYGINVYLELINRLKDQNNGNPIVPFKSIHDFVRHKKYLLDRLLYIKKEYEVGDDLCALINEYRRIYLLLDSIRLSSMKSQIKTGVPPQLLCVDNIYTNKLIGTLRNAYNLEMVLIPQILRSLSQLKYQTGYLDNHYVISLTSPVINTDESYLEFNIEQPLKAYRLDIIRNTSSKFVTRPERILINNVVSYYVQPDGYDNSCIRSVYILCESVTNIKIYTNVDNANYTINVFCAPSIREKADVAELKINQQWCKFNHIKMIRCHHGLEFWVSNRDPYIIWEKYNINADAFKFIHIKMSVMADSHTGQVFFTTSSNPNFCVENSISFNIVNNGEMNSYYIDMSQNKNWRGIITLFRIDPIHYTQNFSWDSRVDRTCYIETVELLRKIPIT